MFKCHVCQSTTFVQQTTHEIFEINGKFYLVENIPVEICTQCGEEIFDSKTTERIRQMLHETNQPVKTISVDVLSYQTAS